MLSRKSIDEKTKDEKPIGITDVCQQSCVKLHFFFTLIGFRTLFRGIFEPFKMFLRPITIPNH